MIQIERHTLHDTIDDRVLLEYSAFKLGDRRIVQKYADMLAAKIVFLMNPQEKYVMWGTHKKPYTAFSRKNCTLVDEIVSERLGLSFIVAEYTYTYDPKNFYDNDMDRKLQYRPVLRDEDRVRILGTTPIFFDDSIVRGSVLNTSARLLEGLAERMIFISGVDLSKESYIEQRVNDLYFREKGLEGLIQIINQPEYVFTTHMMRTIYGLSSDEQAKLLKRISQDKRELFLKGYQIQFEHPFIGTI